MRRPGHPGAATLAALAAGALVAGSLIPLAPAQLVFEPPTLGLLIAVPGLAVLAPVLAVWAAATGEAAAVPARLRAAGLWAACGLGIVGAAAAVAASAETLDLENIVLAQRNTALYALKQPLAAWVYVMALALAAPEPALRAVFGRAGKPRTAVLLLALAVLAGLGATLFLGGFSGGATGGPVWVGLKTIGVAILVLALREAMRGAAETARAGLAWAGALAGLVNLAVTVARAPG